VSQLKGTLLPTGEGYVYRWGDPQDPDLVTIQISEMRLRNGSPYCVLTTYTNMTGARSMADGHVLSSEVWLRNERGRADYAAALTRLIPAPPNATPIDFGAMMEEMARLVARRGAGYRDLAEMRRRAGVSAAALDRLARADAFGSLELDRRGAKDKL